MNSVDKEDVPSCSFCQRTEGDPMIYSIIASSKNGVAICNSCAEQTYLISVRTHELMHRALDNFAKAQEADQRYDADGDCQCPNCGLEKLMKNDNIMKELKTHAMFVAEEVVPEGVVKH